MPLLRQQWLWLLLVMAAEKRAVLALFVVTTNPIARIYFRRLSPRVALCEVAPLEVVFRHLVHIAPGALRHVLPRHLDVDLNKKNSKTKKNTTRNQESTLHYQWWHR